MCLLPLTLILVASEAMVASKWPQRSYDLRFDISNLDYPGIHVHIASNGLLANGSLQMTSEVTSDLGIKLCDLDYLCSHVSLASKGLHELNDTEGGRRPNIIHWLRVFDRSKNLPEQNGKSIKSMKVNLTSTEDEYDTFSSLCSTFPL